MRLLGYAILLLACVPGGALAQCPNASSSHIVVTPRSVVAGEDFSVLAALAEPLGPATFAGQGPDGKLHPSVEKRSSTGPPFRATARFTAGPSGDYEVVLATGDNVLACARFSVTDKRIPRVRTRVVWEVEREWDRGAELLYSAWLELLFDAPEGTSWRPLARVTQDAARNFLHGHLSKNEDAASGKTSMNLRPDCADNPFYLRAYFAWKLGLPYGYHTCSRGTARRPPRCREWTTNLDKRPKGNPARSFYRFLRRLKSRIHSGSARTMLDAEQSDLYPLKLERAGLLPGAVFADPYGHTLMVARWVDQQQTSPGTLLAVDAQPDGTITIKRFWQGNFLFTNTGVIGAPGFKAFRPAIQEGRKVRFLTNDEISAHPGYANLSEKQAGMKSADFHDAMQLVINPRPLDPVAAFKELHEALHEQTLTRVTSIDNGELYMSRNRGKVIEMPKGPTVFRTSGPWEDYSTPARDMRLLIAMDTVADFPNRVVRSPDAFAIPDDKDPAAIKAELEELHRTWAAEYVFSYTKSNGEQRRLTMQDLFDRGPSFEMAYNPNDCPEVRWGEPRKSGESRSCRRRTPKEQRNRMKKYRDWFKNRRRPSW